MSDTTEITEKESAEIMTAEDEAVLAELRKMNEKQEFVKYDTIKLKNSEKKVEGLTRGHYFIESYDGSKPDGERKTFRDIGANPQIVILSRAYTYSESSTEDGLLAFTTDIGSFDANQYVQLFSKKNSEGKMTLEFSGVWPQFKAYMADHYVTVKNGKSEKMLTFQNLLYVLFEGKVYRMFVSNASAAGVAEGALGGDFKNPQPLSLLAYIASTQQQTGSALCDYVCELGSTFKDDVEIPYYIRQFKNVGRTPTPTLIAAARATKSILMDAMKQQKDIAEKKAIVSLGLEMNQDTTVIDYDQDRIKASDLPF